LPMHLVESLLPVFAEDIEQLPCHGDFPSMPCNLLTLLHIVFARWRAGWSAAMGW